MAVFLKGIQPNDFLGDFGLETRQLSLAFLNCLRLNTNSSVMACMV